MGSLRNISLTSLKINFSVEKLCQTKVHLLIGHIGHAETLVRSPRRRSVKPHFPHSPLHRSGVYIYIGAALWNIGRILRPAPLGLRYHRALCLGRRDDRIRRISQASNVKEPTRFMVTSWIVGGGKGHDRPFNPSSFSAKERLTLPLSARMKNI